MRTIYIDSDFKCYTTAAEGRTAAEVEFFDGKCQTFVEGYRFVPAGQSWTREDGTLFNGEMAAPHIPYAQLDAAQREYERQLLTDAEADNAAYQAALAELGVTV